jgi:hypothetical protein
MRKMEILNLKFKQIRIWMKGGEIELTDTKSGKREFVPINDDIISNRVDEREAVNQLSSHLKRRPARVLEMAINDK